MNFCYVYYKLGTEKWKKKLADSQDKVGNMEIVTLDKEAD